VGASGAKARPSVNEQMDVLKRGAAEVIEEGELARKIERSLAQDRPLIVKLGVDPTAPDLHLGHAVVLRKARQFQDLGHLFVLLIGDFTGRVGDPSGRNEARPQLEPEVLERNALTYLEQAKKILDDDPRRLRVDRNSRWLAGLRFADITRLASRFTVARMLERQDFAARYKAEVPIYLHEFFYPLMQGYDSVELKADVELGGTEQKFNLLVARNIQRDFNLEPEVAFLMPVLEGTDGVQRMGKSRGNYIGLDEPPREMYGKTMSIPDSLIMRYAEVCTGSSQTVAFISGHLEADKPRDAKMRLAREIVTLYHGPEAARAAEDEFVRVFSRGELPEEMPEVVLAPDALCGMAEPGAAGPLVRLSRLIVAAGLAPSNSEARRLIAQGGVRFDGARLDDPECTVTLRDGVVVQVGRRRVARLRIAREPGGVH